MLMAAILENGHHALVFHGISGRQADSDTLAQVYLAYPVCIHPICDV